MANVLVKQIVSARTRNVVTCDDSVLTALSNELVGKVEVYTEEGSSGALTLSPEVANKQRYSVGSKMGRVYTNCSFTVPHVKTTVSSPEVVSLAIANLDSNYVSSKTPDYCNLIYDAKKEA
ncbi:hypothetical protein [Wolinella succinogenes]|uniref:hypothetical protein n=1 Tax=Wolinella succinogenes TaxID=844 RepID=UPI002FCAACA4